MARTNFAALTDEEKTVWSRDFWKTARNNMMIQRFMGTSQNSVIQRITELTKDERGTRAVITLVQDMTSDGTTGDFTLEGNEEELKSDENVIQIDQLRHANRSKGKLAEQESIVRFREESRDKLAYWVGDRCDQIAFLTMSGITFAKHNNGSTRVERGMGHAFTDLSFSADVTAPSNERHVRWNEGGKELDAGNTANVTAADKLSYQCIVRLKEHAQNNYIKGLKAGGNMEMFYLFVTPTQMADLRLDPDYLLNQREAGVRGKGNDLFTGTDMTMVDGTMIVPFRHVYHTNGAAVGDKWGGGAIDGGRALFCGAQSLAMVDLPGSQDWIEKTFDYGNQLGISTGKMFGFLKPKLNAAPFYESAQDFGIVACDTAN